MPSWELKILTAEAERLLALAADDAELRAELRALAETILAATNGGSVHLAAGSAIEGSPFEAAAAIPGSPEILEDSRATAPGDEPLRELTLGQPRWPSDQTEHLRAKLGETPSTDDERRSLERRCRLKAAAAQYAAARVRQPAGALAQAPEDAESAQWAAQLVDSFFWSSQQEPAGSCAPAVLDEVAGCFEAVAEALALVDASSGTRGPFERALQLVAEAQSGLRRALGRLGAAADPDQCAVYEWLRATAARHRVYLPRFMRAQDLADPGGWPDLLARIRAHGPSDPHAQQQQAHLDLLREAVDRLRANPANYEAGRAVAQLVAEMVDDGVPPSHRGIRELLLPVLDDLPHGPDQAPAFQLVLRELDRFLAAQAPGPAAAAVEEPTTEVKQASALIGGRSVVLIGGVRRPAAQRELKTTLRMKELVWVETKEHQSIASFEPFVARPDVALVLLAIRWSSHAFGDVKQFCERHGKPLVRLPGGYGPNQVAAQILAQCSQQLGGP